MGDAGGQHARLAGACARQHEQGAVYALDGVALFLVQALQVIGQLLAPELASNRSGSGAVERVGFTGHKGPFQRCAPGRAGQRGY